MFKDGLGIKKAYIACGYTDLRYGVDGLASLVQYQFNLNPFDEGTIFLFCGKKADRIKALLWEGDGFLLLYKRLANGRFRWPRSKEELRDITMEQYQWLMVYRVKKVFHNFHRKKELHKLILSASECPDLSEIIADSPGSQSAFYVAEQTGIRG